MMFILSSTVHTYSLLINASELTVEWRLVRGSGWLVDLSTGLKQLRTPITTPLPLPRSGDSYCEPFLLGPVAFLRVCNSLSPRSHKFSDKTIGAFTCSRLCLEKFRSRARKYTVAVRKRSCVQDGL